MPRRVLRCVVVPLVRQRWIRLLGVLLLFIGDARQVGATTITVGTRIPIDATTFAVPIEITAGLSVIGWQFPQL